MAKTSIGIDIGGTKIYIAVIKDGEMAAEPFKFSTPDTKEELMNIVTGSVEKILAKYPECKVVGIATAGAVNKEGTKIIGSTGNMPEGYNTLDFKETLSSQFGLDVLIENDANAAAYAEYKIGAARGQDNTITITLGTGIGGGIIIDGNLLKGKSGVAAEVGHMQISENPKRKCTCGAYDCWESYASGTGYAINAKEMVLDVPAKERGFLKDKNIDTITSFDIIEGKKCGDKLCQQIHERWENLVLKGLIALGNIFDPESIVISGGMVDCIDLKKLEDRLNKELTASSKVRLLRAQAGNYAGMLGAILLAEEKYCG
jgi:glucokinase